MEQLGNTVLELVEPIPVVGELAKSLNAAGDAAKSNVADAGLPKIPEAAPAPSLAGGPVDESDPKQLLASTNFYRSLADKQGPIADSLRGRSPEELGQLAMQGVPQTADGVVNFATGMPPAAPGTRQEYDRQQAIKQMFGGSRDLPADFEMLASNLPPTERGKLRQLFEDNKPGDLTKPGGSLYWAEKGDGLLRSTADWSDRTFGGPRPDDRSFSGNLQRGWRTAVETLPSGTATFLEHVGTTMDSLTGSADTTPLIGETPEQTQARLYPIATDAQALGKSYADRYGPVIEHGDFSKLKSDYFNDPVGTFLQDAQPVLLFTPLGKSVLGKGGAGAARLGEGVRAKVSLAGEQGSLTPTQLASGRLAGAESNLDRAMQGRYVRLAKDLAGDLKVPKDQVRGTAEKVPWLKYSANLANPELDTVISSQGRMSALGEMRYSGDGAPSEVPRGGQPGDRDALSKTFSNRNPRLEPSGDPTAVIESTLRSYPETSAVVQRLMEDHRIHPTDTTNQLYGTAGRDSTLAKIKELAEGRTLAGKNLESYIKENPGKGPLFNRVSDSVNHDRAGASLKDSYVSRAKEIDAGRAVGANPGTQERSLVDDYGRRLSNEVEPSVRREIEQFASSFDGVRYSIRTKDSNAILDKVQRMSSGSAGRPPRPDYQVGDVIDAVGARITARDTEQLGQLLQAVTDHFGTGPGGRILEIENMYAQPKSAAPSYRVIPLVIKAESNGLPYTFELQLNTERAAIAADLEHNTLFKPYVQVSPQEAAKVKSMLDEAAALDQAETRGSGG